MNEVTESEQKERDKVALVAALSQFLSYEECSNPANIRELVLAAPGDVDKSLQIIPALHKAGLLEQYIKDLQTEDKLINPELEPIVGYILQATHTELSTVPVKSTFSTESLSVGHSSVSRKLGCSGIFSFSPKTRENLKNAGMFAGLSIGPALFIGTGIAGFVLSAKATATATAVVAFAATAGTAFPPLGIALLAHSAAMILASAIILIALAANQKGKGVLMDKALAATVTNHSI